MRWHAYQASSAIARTGETAMCVDKNEYPRSLLTIESNLPTYYIARNWTLSAAHLQFLRYLSGSMYLFTHHFEVEVQYQTWRHWRHCLATLSITRCKLTRASVRIPQRAQQTNPCHPTGPSLLSAPMHPAVSRIAENVAKHHLLLAPLLYTVLGAVASVNSPVQHSLLVTSASWAIVWAPLVLRVGLYSNNGGTRKSTSWLAGASLALAHICDRAACDKDGTRAMKVAISMAWMTAGLTQLSGCFRSLQSSSPRMNCSRDTLLYPPTPAATRPTRTALLRRSRTKDRPTCW